MKKLYTGSIKKLTVKNINIFPAAIEKIAFESVVVEKDSLFYMNFFGVPISVDYGTKLLTKSEAECYIKDFAKAFPGNLDKASCIYANGPFKFSHEITNDDFKKLIKQKRIERKKGSN